MTIAATAARTRIGATNPNPAVGAVALDKSGQVIETEIHHHAGGAHAETRLLESCRLQNRLQDIATLCVTLEPCNHEGKTPPCTTAIINAGIKRVVIGTRDPNPCVTGGGIEFLQQAGIEVICGVNEDECRWLIHAFAQKAKTGKAWVTVKRALDHQGSMLPSKGQKTFTSPSSLTLAHKLRKKADAIITGSGTILADAPLFTVRHVPDYPEKKRWLAIMDRRGQISESYLKQALALGFLPVIYRDITYAIHDLTEMGADDILIEAGPSLSDHIMAAEDWTMAVTIKQGNPDDIKVEFSPKAPIFPSSSSFKWSSFLPAEEQESLS